MNIFGRLREAAEFRRKEAAKDRAMRLEAAVIGREKRREAERKARIKAEESKGSQWKPVGQRIKENVQTRMKAMQEKRKKQEKTEKGLKEITKRSGGAFAGESGGVFANMQHRNIHEGVGRNIWEDKPKKNIWED